ncbi:sodium:calcium antiporter [Dongia deserti]|uniref:sodium:calcium antiporter n=1 Tax=Dongia deserti TaxID=2268030 RepID=UPI000E64EA12|nr:sodium:calcium antiporter [Dongia deserti]
MQDLVTIWGALALALAVTGAAGTVLSHYGDVISSKTGLSGSWIGLVLMATITSLPELSTGISAVTIGQAPNIAAGDALGSCVFNLVMFALLDMMLRDKPLYAEISDSHTLGATFGIVLIGIVGLGILIAPLGAPFALGHVGIVTPVLVVAYAYIMWAVFLREREANAMAELIDRYPEITLRTAVTRYAIAALFVVAAGISLPFIGKELSSAMGWSTSFVGTLFVAGVTSAPELVVTAAAMRIGAIDMAAGNLLGSNLFNMLVVAIDDLAFLDGSLLGSIRQVHASSALSAIVMSAVVIAALQSRAHRKIYRLPSLPSVVLIAVYAVNAWVLFRDGG